MEFKTKKEWEAAADKLFAEGKSPQEINKIVGQYKGPEGTFTVQQAAKSKRGWTPVDKEARKARNQKRLLAITEQDDKLVETLKKGGMSDTEAQAILKKEKAGYKRIEHQASALNKEHGKGAFNAGHETAALEGGGNYGRNARVEIGKSRTRADGTRMRGNQSRGRIDEAPDSIKPAMGIPRSGRGGEDTALINLLEKDNPGIMDLGLTPKDKQDIKRNPAGADDIIAARQARVQVKNGVAKFGKKVSKVIPGSLDDVVIGGVMATAAAGGVLLAGGSPVQAGEAALEAGVDVATSELQGGNLADGTLQSNQDKVKQTLYQEPKNTAAPTGDTTFDAVAQPLIKGLAGQPMHPTSANGVIQLKR
jgi:hypothetical protein